MKVNKAKSANTSTDIVGEQANLKKLCDQWAV